MKKEIAVCDFKGCKKECDKDETIFICTGRVSDGNEMVNDGKYVDLCSSHKTIILKKILKNMSYGDAHQILNMINGF